jgi:DNA replication protein DnaC
MDSQDFSRSRTLNNIPSNKFKEKLSFIENSEEDLKIKNLKLTALNRYYESNIPIEYWNLKMEKNFVGDKRLLDKYLFYVEDIKKSYIDGTSICFASPHGRGKTMTACCILKKACQKGYSCLYSDLLNIISVLTQAPTEEKFNARRELYMVDFLCIDELDPRFFNSSDLTNELYIKNLESIIRTRLQNNLPTLMCSNSPNIVESFNGTLKISMDSLFNKIETFVILGEDFRKKSNG